MKKSIGIILGLGMMFIISISSNSHAQVVAYGYYMKTEQCPDTEGAQKRCREGGSDWCQVSQQTSCPEFQGLG